MLIDNAHPSNPIITNPNGLGLIYDPIRDKTLSINRNIISFGINHKNITGQRWMKTSGNVISIATGYKIPRDATITSVTIQTENIIDNCRFNVRTNNQMTDLHSLVLVSTKDKIEDDLNIDINKGDYIQLFLAVLEGTLDYPVVTIEIAWR